MGNKSKLLSRAFSLIFIVLMLICAFTFSASAEDDTIYIEVQSIETDENSKYITLLFDNNTGSKLSIGFGSNTVMLVTSDGEYETDLTIGEAEIPRGESILEVSFYNCTGTVEQVIIPELNKLGASGLPENELKDVVIYYANEDIDSFEDDFPLIRPIFIIPIVIFSIFIVIVILILIFYTKKRNKSIKQFNPYQYSNNQNLTDREINNNLNNDDGFAPPPM